MKSCPSIPKSDNSSMGVFPCLLSISLKVSAASDTCDVMSKLCSFACFLASLNIEGLQF